MPGGTFEIRQDDQGIKIQSILSKKNVRVVVLTFTH